MTVEEMKARIAELEAENDILRGHKRKTRWAIPKNVVKAFGGVSCERTALENMGKSIRFLCFPRVLKKRKLHADNPRERLTEFVITVDEMTENQYEEYVDLFTKITEILKPHLYYKEGK